MRGRGPAVNPSCELFASRNADSTAVNSMVHIMVATVASRSSAIFQT
jgi:hypothetical protein